jgi:predicted transcriptional regulator of viral defense system
MQEQRLRVFTTADLATLAGINPVAASQALQRLASKKLVVRVKRGVWANRLVSDLHPYEIVPFLGAPWLSYVSLYSALADYGVIEEVPAVLYAVSARGPKRYRTPVGDFHFHHLPERLIWGYEIKRIGLGSYPIAEPEKAFLDLVYLALVPRSPLRFPPQRGKPWRFNQKKITAYAKRFQFPPLVDYLHRSSL